MNVLILEYCFSRFRTWNTPQFEYKSGNAGNSNLLLWSLLWHSFMEWEYVSTVYSFSNLIYVQQNCACQGLWYPNNDAVFCCTIASTLDEIIYTVCFSACRTKTR